MAISGTLAIVGIVLVVVQLVLGGAINTATHDGPGVFVPLLLGLMCLAAAFLWGLVKGPWAVRLAALCGFGSLAFLGKATQEFLRDAYRDLAASAALFILAITLWVFAYTAERATSHESSVRGVAGQRPRLSLAGIPGLTARKPNV